MEIQTEITRQDVIDFNIYHHARSRMARGPWGCFLVSCLLWLAFLLFGCLRSAHPWQTAKAIAPLWSFFPLVLLLLLFRRFWVAHVANRMLGEGKNQGLFGVKRVRISPESFQEAGEWQTTATDWQAVERIETSPQAAYVYVNAVSAFIIPRRCFAEEAAFHEFVRLARQYQAEAKGTL